MKDSYVNIPGMFSLCKTSRYCWRQPCWKIARKLETGGVKLEYFCWPMLLQLQEEICLKYILNSNIAKSWLATALNALVQPYWNAVVPFTNMDYFVLRRRENMFWCIGSRVNSNYEWIFSCAGWISNHMPSKVSVDISYPFPNFNGVWEWISNFIPHFTGHVITYPCWWIKVNPCLFLAFISMCHLLCFIESSMSPVSSSFSINYSYKKDWAC